LKITNGKKQKTNKFQKGKYQTFAPEYTYISEWFEIFKICHHVIYLFFAICLLEFLLLSFGIYLFFAICFLGFYLKSSL